MFFDWCGDTPARNMFARNRACHACLKKYPVDISSARLKRSGTRLGFAYARLAKCRRFRGVLSKDISRQELCTDEWEHFPIGLVYMVLFGKASGFLIFMHISMYFYV